MWYSFQVLIKYLIYEETWKMRKVLLRSIFFFTHHHSPDFSPRHRSHVKINFISYCVGQATILTQFYIKMTLYKKLWNTSNNIGTYILIMYYSFFFHKCQTYFHQNLNFFMVRPLRLLFLLTVGQRDLLLIGRVVCDDEASG